MYIVVLPIFLALIPIYGINMIYLYLAIFSSIKGAFVYYIMYLFGHQYITFVGYLLYTCAYRINDMDEFIQDYKKKIIVIKTGNEHLNIKIDISIKQLIRIYELLNKYTSRIKLHHMFEKHDRYIYELLNKNKIICYVSNNILVYLPQKKFNEKQKVLQRGIRMMRLIKELDELMKESTDSIKNKQIDKEVNNIDNTIKFLDEINISKSDEYSNERIDDYLK